MVPPLAVMGVQALPPDLAFQPPGPTPLGSRPAIAFKLLLLEMPALAMPAPHPTASLLTTALALPH